MVPGGPRVAVGNADSVAGVTDAPAPRDLQAEAVVDLVGALAYGELTAFTRLAADARLAPTLADEVALSGYAARRFRDFRRLADHLTALGVDPEAAMAPFVGPLDAFHDMTAPADFLEGLVKAYVGDGIARDFYREMADLLDVEGSAAASRDLLLQVLVEAEGARDYVVGTVTRAVEADPSVAGRLALWARRLVGEALTQTQRAAAERDALLELVGERRELSEMLALLGRVTEGHGARMDALGLSG